MGAREDALKRVNAALGSVGEDTALGSVGEDDERARALEAVNAAVAPAQQGQSAGGATPAADSIEEAILERPEVPQESQDSDIPDDLILKPVDIRPDQPDLVRPGMSQEDVEADLPEDIPDPRYVELPMRKILIRPETPLDMPTDLSEPDPVQLANPVALAPNDITDDMIAKTGREVGGLQQQEGVTTVTEGAFRTALAGPAATGNKVVIDPNTNVAQVISTDGSVIAEYQIGTGDITGDRYGKKYFTPTGLGTIIDKQKRPVGPGEEGPYKLRLSLSFYEKRNPFLLHGQYDPDEVIRERDQFINKGFVSHGCVRFFNDDMNALVKLIGKGSVIEILDYVGEGFGDKKVFGRTKKAIASIPERGPQVR
jgi:lipoprotein-anchoring transpeptidase ErfK/SrfK